MAKPDTLRIPHDEYHFEFVGRLRDGTQFMGCVTGAFPTGMQYYVGDDWQTKKKWLAVLHRFDRAGNHIRSEARLGGFEFEGRELACHRAFEHLRTIYTDLLAGDEAA